MTFTLDPTPDPASRVDADRFGRPDSGWRLRLYSVIFESDTRAGLRRSHSIRP